MKLISELRRRNVFRMAALYVAAAWVVMQVAGELMDLGALPAAVGPWILVALVIGFPIALVFSWLFEITPEGLAREEDVSEGASITHVTGRRMDFIVIAVLSAGLILFAADKWWQPAPPELSIAVLPFENMSADPEQEYFADGIAEETRNLLTRIQALKVIARTSSLAFKGKNESIATIAQQLNVRHVLEGSVRSNGNRVRITAQLIDAKDSSNLWSDTFDRDLTASDLFYIESEIARAIADRLRITLTDDDEKRLAEAPTENTEAYAAYLLGRQRLADPDLTAAKATEAVEQFALAVELDPQFAGAYSGLADACLLYEAYSDGQDHEECPSAAGREQLARKALELDPESGEAWSSLGISIWSQWRPSLENIKDYGLPAISKKLQEAMAAFERGVELSGDRAMGYQWAWYGSRTWFFHVYPDASAYIKAWQSGRFGSILDRGLEVDPLSIQLHRLKSWYPVSARSKEEAFRHARRMIEIAPDSPRGYDRVGQLEWSINGRFDEAVRWRSKALAMAPDDSGFPEFIAYEYTALGDLDMAIAYYDLASALVGPDNQQRQQEIVRVKMLTRLTLGQYDAQQLVEQFPQLGDVKTPMGNDWDLFMFIDLATGRPEDALARIEAEIPMCLGATEIPETMMNCPVELVRIYQELGDDSAAQTLGDAIVRRAKLWADGIPAADWMRLDYAAALATTGQTHEALDILEDLVASGWRGDNYNPNPGFKLCCDVIFDAIRDDERFRAIVATFEADMARQLENVREMQRRGEVPTLEEVKALIASAQESE